MGDEPNIKNGAVFLAQTDTMVQLSVKFDSVEMASVFFDAVSALHLDKATVASFVRGLQW